MLVTKQGHHALVRLLARELVGGVQRDGALAFVVDIDHHAQAGIAGQRTDDLGGRTQTQVGLHLHHGQLDRAVSKNLHDQRPIELDVGLHQGGCSHHLAQHVLHRQWVSPLGVTRVAPRQDVGPGVSHAHQHTANRQAIK